MAHILEGVQTGDETFTAFEVIEERLTGLAVRIGDAKVLTEHDEAKKVLEDWRGEIFFARNAIRRIGEAIRDAKKEQADSADVGAV